MRRKERISSIGERELTRITMTMMTRMVRRRRSKYGCLERQPRHLLQGGVLFDKSGKGLLPIQADFVPPEAEEREPVVNLKGVVEQRRALVRDLVATRHKQGVRQAAEAKS